MGKADVSHRRWCSVWDVQKIASLWGLLMLFLALREIERIFAFFPGYLTRHETVVVIAFGAGCVRFAFLVNSQSGVKDGVWTWQIHSLFWTHDLEMSDALDVDVRVIFSLTLEVYLSIEDACAVKCVEGLEMQEAAT